MLAQKKKRKTPCLARDAVTVAVSVHFEEDVAHAVRQHVRVGRDHGCHVIVQCQKRQLRVGLVWRHNALDVALAQHLARQICATKKKRDAQFSQRSRVADPST